MITEKQVNFLKNCNKRINIRWGSVRSGKTFIQNLNWISYCKNGPVGNLVICGKTERTIKRNIIEPVKEILDKEAYTKQGEFWIGNRKCDIVGANDERAEEKIRGATLAGAYCDEISLYPQSFFDMLDTRLSIPGAKLFGTTNPDSPHHWLKKNYLDNPNKSIYHAKFELNDNADNLDPIYLQDLKSKCSGLFYRRYILGEWVLAEGVVYDMFGKDCIVTETPQCNHTIIGIDYGIANPTCFVKIQFDDNEKVYVTDEYYYDYKKNNKQKTDTELADDLIHFIGNDKVTVYVDPSALSFIVELKKRRLRVKNADNNVLNGIAFISQYFHNKHLYIKKQCDILIKQLGIYSWDQKAQIQGIDKPLKIEDHACDAMRYAIYSHFQKYARIIIPFSGKIIQTVKYVGY
jgi:PBSX family phage terminase large subunit